MKKLIPALCLLLISALLMGTSTFAWFSMNTTVTATGMEIKAAADASLVIKGKTETNYTATGSVSAKNESMKPCTSYDGVNFGILGSSVNVSSAASAAASWMGTSDALAATDLVATTSANESTYVLTAEFSIKNLSAAADVYVKSITLTTGTGAAKDISKAVRCSVKMGTNTALVFNIGGGTNLSEGVGKYASSTWSLATPSYTNQNTQAAKMGSLTADTAQDVVVKIWFEGQDSKCYSDAVDTKNYTVQLEFTSAKPSTAK